MNKKKTNWTKAGFVVALIIGILTIILMIYYENKGSGTTQDNDFVDNKGATNPTTVVNMNYKKPNRELNETYVKELQKRLISFDKSQDTIMIFYTCGEESRNFAYQYLEHLQKAGWRVRTPIPMLTNPQIDGISFGGGDGVAKLSIEVGCNNS